MKNDGGIISTGSNFNATPAVISWYQTRYVHMQINVITCLKCMYDTAKIFNQLFGSHAVMPKEPIAV